MRWQKAPEKLFQGTSVAYISNKGVLKTTSDHTGPFLKFGPLASKLGLRPEVLLLPASGRSPSPLFTPRTARTQPPSSDAFAFLSLKESRSTPTLWWAEQNFHNLIYWNEVDKGGHFAAWQQPELFATEIRAAFRSLR